MDSCGIMGRLQVSVWAVLFYLHYAVNAKETSQQNQSAFLFGLPFLHHDLLYICYCTVVLSLPRHISTVFHSLHLFSHPFSEEISLHPWFHLLPLLSPFFPFCESVVYFKLTLWNQFFILIPFQVSCLILGFPQRFITQIHFAAIVNTYNYVFHLNNGSFWWSCVRTIKISVPSKKWQLLAITADVLHGCEPSWILP